MVEWTPANKPRLSPMGLGAAFSFVTPTLTYAGLSLYILYRPPSKKPGFFMVYLKSSGSLLVPEPQPMLGTSCNWLESDQELWPNSTGCNIRRGLDSEVGGSGVNRGHYSQSTGGVGVRGRASVMGRALASKSEKPHTCRIRIGSSDSRNR